MMERMSKEQMLNRINQLSFAVVEMTLYLDIILVMKRHWHILKKNRPFAMKR